MGTSYIAGTVDISGTVRRPVIEAMSQLWSLKLIDTTGVEALLATDTTIVKEAVIFNWNTRNISGGNYELILSCQYADTTCNVKFI